MLVFADMTSKSISKVQSASLFVQIKYNKINHLQLFILSRFNVALLISRSRLIAR